MVTDVEVTAAIRKLAVTFTKPDAPEADLVGLWRHVLEGVDGGALREAVSAYLRGDNRFFPKPGQIRAAALEIMGHSYGQERAVDSSRDWNQLQDGPCPVCGAVLQLATAKQRLGYDEIWDHKKRMMRPRTENDPAGIRRFAVIHNLAMHAQARVPAVGGGR